MSAYNDIWSALSKVIPNINTSSAGILHRITEVVGSFIDIVRLEMLRSEQTIAQAAKAARIMSASYYIDKSLAYQEGDDLIVINQATQELGYADIDATKQIIKQVSIVTTGVGSFYINVATADSNNNVQSLTPSQLEAFQGYIQNFIAIGTNFDAISNPPSILTATNMYVRYYESYNLDTIKTNLDKTMRDIQVELRKTNVVYVNEIENRLASVEGIRDVYLVDPILKISETITEEPVTGSFTQGPGYFNFDPDLYVFDNGEDDKTQFEAV